RLCMQIERTNGFQEPETSTKWKTQLAEMIIREIVQDVGTDRVLAENRLILFEAKAPPPSSEVHGGVLTAPPRMIVQAKKHVQGVLLDCPLARTKARSRYRHFPRQPFQYSLQG